MKLIVLSDEFYDHYAGCAEIMKKNDRPYAQMRIQINDTVFAVPLRSNIRHNHVFWTDKENRCGLDFSKTVAILDERYILDDHPQIRQKEFNALIGQDHIIEQKLMKYIGEYKRAKADLSRERNVRLCAYSSLQYFEDYI